MPYLCRMLQDRCWGGYSSEDLSGPDGQEGEKGEGRER